MRLTYNEIAARLGLSALESDIALTATVTDSREAAPGALFVCIPGSRVDGHDFVPAAVELGASAVLASRALPVQACCAGCGRYGPRPLAA